jgi:thiamine phosphate synthase YjbQ (UPF0047 family)
LPKIFERAPAVELVGNGKKVIVLALVMARLTAIDRDLRVAPFNSGDLFSGRWRRIFLMTFDDKIMARNAILCNSKR